MLFWYTFSMPTQISCLELLHKLVILSPEELRGVEEKVATADVQSLVGFEETLQSLLGQQADFFGKMVAADPEFPSKFAAFLHGRIDSLQTKTAATDASELNAIEQQLS